MTIQENVRACSADHFESGRRGALLCRGAEEDEVREAVEFAKTRGLPLFVLGGGSNLVVADSGWPGLVLKIAIGGIATPKQNASGNAVLFSVGAGVKWDDFVAFAVSQNCAGVECLSGIPGSVGGTPVQNVGAYGQDVAETIESVRALDTKGDRACDVAEASVRISLSLEHLQSRGGREGGGERGRFIILQVNYRLKRGGAPRGEVRGFAEAFRGAAVEAKEV